MPNHPKIATINGLEESNSTHYLVMELASGGDPAERVMRDGSVPVEGSLSKANRSRRPSEPLKKKVSFTEI